MYIYIHCIYCIHCIYSIGLRCFLQRLSPFHLVICIYIWNSERQFKKHFNPIEYIQCPEFSTTPAVFISGTTSTLMKTAGVVENSGHCIYSIGLRCFWNCLSLFHLVFYLLQSNTRYFVDQLERFAYHYIYICIYIHIYAHTYIYICTCIYVHTLRCICMYSCVRH